ncbi:type IX secretion system membrane protein PorP/SprF [Flammeovirga kamogawensis]|uniref:Type IX secretion system membrane protein PorP/SprF n=1 Tax=Flammeovirga kamogawensis TaxID=373891 RepID=A0ABX8GRR1_9BACT|nr:type IX secretion system membrane protein PorP/SprF [Flammeovirga kamogawensis]MBB6463691.1 hypothetical protein [Flammeovirga kamogawensis]QWG06191.1 type IX secretion system membrane protein PorP/SprF [Flammeovirga kamogawensis]TRX68022.1 type IX secretion system membrane protein PorP/SprF [Flammeovirga kamogawensis]
MKTFLLLTYLVLLQVTIIKAQDVISATPLWLPSSQNPALAGSSFNKGNVAFRYATIKDGLSYINVGGDLGIQKEKRNGLGIGINYNQLTYPFRQDDNNEKGNLKQQALSIPLSMLFRNEERAFSFGISLGYLQYSIDDNFGTYYSQLNPNSSINGNSPSYSFSNRQESTFDIGAGVSFFTHEHFLVSVSAKHLQNFISSENEASLFNQLQPRVEFLGQYIIHNPISSLGLISTAGYFWENNSQQAYLSVEGKIEIISLGGGWIPNFADNVVDNRYFITSSVDIPIGEKATLSRRGRIEKAKNIIGLKLVYYPSISNNSLIYPTIEFTLSAKLSNNKFKKQLKRLTSLPTL